MLALLATAVAGFRFTQEPAHPSAWWLGALPDGETKRRFVLDCTGCHQFDSVVVRPGGQPRAQAEWARDIRRMLGIAGARSNFPVISAARDADSTADWLVASLASPRPERSAGAVATGTAQITEYRLPQPNDLPHDLALERSGGVVVTGTFTNQLYRVDPANGRMTTVPIPVRNAGARAVEIDSAGNWWVLLGGSLQAARYETRTATWQMYNLGMYAHSLAIDAAGKVWFNGHFTRDPELIGSVDYATAEVQTVPVPAHPALAGVAGGPLPYELRAGPDARVWISELMGNRIIGYAPATGRFETYDLPTPLSGPRRFDVDRAGVLWIPAYAANLLVRFDPATRRFTEYPVPLSDALPYVVRVDPGNGTVWMGTGAADALLAFEPAAQRWTQYPLPSHGALVRHLAVDPRTHDVWMSYAAWPSRIPARIARLHLQ